MDEKDLSNVNEIDTECSFVDEDDMSGFGGPVEDARPMKTITASMEQHDGVDTLDIKKNWVDPNEDYSNVNEIDMECDFVDDDDDSSFGNIKAESYKAPIEKKELDTSIYYGESVDFSDDDDIPMTKIKETTKKSMFDDDDEVIKEDSDPFGLNDDVPYDDTEELDSKELIDEDMLEEKKTTTPGEVEADYWNKLQNKHKKTNVKGAYNTHFHMSYDPKAEMDDFNAGFTTNGTPSITNSAADGLGGDAGGGEGCCEDLEVKVDNIDWTSLAKALLSIIGFSVNKNENGYIVHDDCESCPDMECKNNEEIFASLKPYIDDCFIYPLQITTGEKYTNCKDWCDWYKGENCNKFAKCADDIKYCDLVANHINDCKF